MSDPLETLMSPQLAQAREQLVFGLVTARVRSIEDDGSYRLDYLTMGDDSPSAAARVMMPMAGGNRGTYFFPEVGDEVVVAFEQGNTNLPVILGAVWNNESPPPSQAQPSPDNNIRTIVSRSGHELTFDDTPGAGNVTLRTSSGHQIVLDDTPGVGKVSIQTAGGKQIVLDDTPPGSVAVSSTLVNLRLDDAGGALTIQASGPITIQGTTISLVGTSVALSGALTINGAPFHLHVHSGGTILGLTGPVSTP